MKSLIRVWLFVIIVAQWGCSTPAPPEPLTSSEISAIEYGKYPEDYKQLIRAYFAKTLANVDEAKFRFGEPYKGYLQHGPLFGGKVLASGYFVDVWLKLDGAGGETEQHVGVVIKDGEVLMQLSPEELQQVKR